MTSFLLRRLMHSLMILFFVSIIGFIIMQLPPGDFLTVRMAELEAAGNPMAGEQIEYLRTRYGLEQPAVVQYYLWISNFVRGDLGTSFQHRRPVTSLIGTRLFLTVVVAVSTMAFTWIVGIPIGIYSAIHKNSFLDHVITVIGFLGLSIPNFLLALVFLVVNVIVLGQSPGGLFSPQYREAAWSLGRAFDLMKHLWVPVVVIGTAGTAGIIRIMRANLLDVLRFQYVQTARSKGLSENRVIYKHAVRNAIHPLIMHLGMSFPQIISGGAIVAIVLNLPTIGPLYLTALQQQDMFLAGSILMILVILLIVGNLVADIMLALVDPRIRFE